MKPKKVSRIEPSRTKNWARASSQKEIKKRIQRYKEEIREAKWKGNLFEELSARILYLKSLYRVYPKMPEERKKRLFKTIDSLEKEFHGLPRAPKPKKKARQKNETK